MFSTSVQCMQPNITHKGKCVSLLCVCVQVTTRLYLPPELPCLGHIQISVSAVGDDGLVYTRTQNAGAQTRTQSLELEI